MKVAGRVVGWLVSSWTDAQTALATHDGLSVKEGGRKERVCVGVYVCVSD